MSGKAIIIEDDVNSAKVLAHLLLKEGIESIIVTYFGQFQSQNPVDAAIIFVDLEMPGISGYEVLEVLMRDAHYQSVPIIASSVHLNEIKQVRDAGFHSFIGKPLRKDVFPNQLRRILAGERIWET
jgi:CheY-like chemotaxis protein